MGLLDGQNRNRHRRGPRHRCAGMRACWRPKARTVVVNDLGTAAEGGGSDSALAQTLVDEIVAAGGDGRGEPRRRRDVGRRRTHRRARCRHLRPARHPRQQCRHPARRDELQHHRRAVGFGDHGALEGTHGDVPSRGEALARPRQGGRGDRGAASSTPRASRASTARPGRSTTRPRRPGSSDDDRARARDEEVRRDRERRVPACAHPHDRDRARRGRLHERARVGSRPDRADGRVPRERRRRRRLGPGVRRVGNARPPACRAVQLAATLDRGEGRWTPQELVDRKAELFANHRSKVPPMGFGSSTWQARTARRSAPRRPVAFHGASSGRTRSRTGISTRPATTHVSAMGHAVEPGRPLAHCNRRAQGRPRRDLTAQRVLPALDRRVRGRAQGGRGRWCRSTRASSLDELVDDPRPRRTRRRSSPATGSSTVPARSPSASSLQRSVRRRSRTERSDGTTQRYARPGGPSAARPPTTSPTSCTRRARPGCRRACSCATATSR